MSSAATYDAFMGVLPVTTSEYVKCSPAHYASSGSDSDDDGILILNCSGVLGEEVGGALLLPSPLHPSLAVSHPSSPSEFTFKPLPSPVSEDTPAKLSCGPSFNSTAVIKTVYLPPLTSKASLTSCASPAVSTETNFIGLPRTDSAQSGQPSALTESAPTPLLTRCNTPASAYTEAGVTRARVVRRPAQLGRGRGAVSAACLPPLSSAAKPPAPGMIFVNVGSRSFSPALSPSPCPSLRLSPSPSPPPSIAVPPPTADTAADLAGSVGSTSAPAPAAQQDFSADAAQALIDALRVQTAGAFRTTTPVPALPAEQPTTAPPRVDRPRNVYNGNVPVPPMITSTGVPVPPNLTAAAAVMAASVPAASLVKTVAARRKRGLPGAVDMTTAVATGTGAVGGLAVVTSGGLLAGAVEAPPLKRTRRGMPASAH